MFVRRKFYRTYHRSYTRVGAAALATLLVVSLLSVSLPVPKAHALNVQPNGCYDGYVLVPGDPTYGTNDFCVMQYEAKDDSGVATSEANLTPWTSISQTDAITAAANACPNDKCHLITDHEWMTIAANVERQAANWSGGAVGSGCLFTGNDGIDNACGYSNGTVADFGTGRNVKARYTLSNGSQVWDFTGNVLEWTSDTIQQKNEPQPAGWDEYTSITNFGTVPYINPLTNTTGLPVGANSWGSTQQLGEVSSAFTAGSSTVRGLIRSSYWNNLSNQTGPFALNLGNSPSATVTSLGFRVVQVPLASGATQVAQRSIELSSSAAGAAGVTYHVNFQAGSSYSLRAIVVDFCSNSPLIGDNCTAPNGFSLGNPPTVSNLLIGGAADGGSWSTSTPDSGRDVSYLRSTGVAITNGETISFDLTGVANPSDVGTFYGRILLYDSGTAGYTATQPGHYSDYGGVALSITPAVTITALVQETLTFCVYHTTCGDNPAVTLGHGSPQVLDSNAVDTDGADFSLSTNAAFGAVVTAQGSPLTSGSNTIPAVASGSGTGGTLSAGTAAFGIAVSRAGDLTIPVAYQGDGTATGHYAFDTTSTPNLTSAYGQIIGSSTGVLDNSVSTVTFAATASPTTPAGVYTTDLGLVATGTF